MEPISAIEAREQFDALLDDVERGREVVITRGGRSVARLVPAAAPATGHGAAEALRALRKGLAAQGLRVTAAELKELRDEGRR